MQYRDRFLGIGLLCVLSLCACSRASAPPATAVSPGGDSPTAARTRREVGTPTKACLPSLTPTTANTAKPTQTPTALPSPQPTAHRPALEAPPPFPLAYVDDLPERELWLVSTDGIQVFLADKVTDHAWSPDGEEIALLREGDLWLVEPNGGAAYRLLRSGHLVEMAWSPSADRIAVIEEVAETSGCTIESTAATRVLLVEIPGGRVQVLLDRSSQRGTGSATWCPQWSPDSRTLYVLGCLAVTTSAVLAIDVETGATRMVTSEAWGFVVLPKRGTLLVREHKYIDVGSHRVACEFRADGTPLEEWPELENTVFAAGPDGTIAFAPEFEGALSLLRPDGRVITTTLPMDSSAMYERTLRLALDWSPDGSWLAVESDHHIWLVNTLNGEGRPLVSGCDPRWRPHIDSE